MNRISEIEARLLAIETECDSCKTKEEANKLLEEVRALVAERKELLEKEPAPVVEEVAPVAVAEKVAPAPAPAPKAAAPAPEQPKEEMRVIRRILVHRNGKVVRVLNEHYYDITTNIYVDKGFTDPNAPVETEQQHFERIINIIPDPNEEPAPAPAPAPAPVVVAEPAPAPAPVQVIVQPAPAPAPVVVEPAPAPAPVVVPAPAPAPAPAAKIERIPFAVRLKKADKGLKLAYNELKAEILSYGIKSRVSNSGDTFRLHTKTYVKLVVAGKSLKLYFALNPKNYKDSTFPIGDASAKSLHKETPLVFKVKSDLSIRRAKSLIADCAAKDKLVQGEVVKHDYVKELK